MLLELCMRNTSKIFKNEIATFKNIKMFHSKEMKEY